VSEQQQIDDFRAWYAKQTQAPTPRIMFALDATASRQPTWDQAAALHAEMFKAAGSESEVLIGGTNVRRGRGRAIRTRC
jgi:hypothetical protein